MNDRDKSSNERVGLGVEVERLRWSLAEVKKEVTAVTPDWARVMRIFNETGPCHSDASLVVRVCTAYEQGFGQSGRALANPYEMLSAEAEAWNIGWQEGKKRGAPETTMPQIYHCNVCGGDVSFPEGAKPSMSIGPGGKSRGAQKTGEDRGEG